MKFCAVLCCVTAVLSLIQPALSAPTNPKAVPESPSRHGRDVQSLNGTWKFLTDPERTGEKNGWDKNTPSEAKETSVPALWTTTVAPDYDGVAWYWKSFDIPSAWHGQSVRLRFAAVAQNADVWLNGQRLGIHDEGNTPFEFNVTKSINFRAPNTLAVKIEGNAKAGAGIWQGVQLLAHDEAYLVDCFPVTDGVGNINISVILLNTSKVTGDATLEAQVHTHDTANHQIKSTEQNLDITPGRNITTLITSVRGKALTLWTPENPALYSMRLVFRQGVDVLDTLETSFAFREFGYKEGSILLNGRPRTLRSVPSTMPLPKLFTTPDDTVRARELLRRMQDKGGTLVYLAAPPPEMLQITDELGMFVVESAPAEESAATQLETLKSLIVRDRAHPSLLAWNLGDVDNATVQSIQQMDPTRFLIVGPTAGRKLWLPNPSDPPSVALPADLLSPP